MKVIDLMYGVLPDKIKVNGKIWTLCNNEYHICDDYGYDYWLEHKDDKFEEDVNLSDEIEIYTPLKHIEDIKITRLGKCFFTDYDDIFTEWITTYNGVIVDKLNEIIDRLNSEDNE